MLKENDKDAIIAHLVETLQNVRKTLDENCYAHDYNDFETMVHCVPADIVNPVIDYIDHRLFDVTF